MEFLIENPLPTHALLDCRLLERRFSMDPLISICLTDILNLFQLVQKSCARSMVADRLVRRILLSQFVMIQPVFFASTNLIWLSPSSLYSEGLYILGVAGRRPPFVNLSVKTRPQGISRGLLSRQPRLRSASLAPHQSRSHESR